MISAYVRYVLPSGATPRGEGRVGGRLSLIAGFLTVLATLALLVPGALSTPELAPVWAGWGGRAALMTGLTVTYAAALIALGQDALNKAAWAGLGLGVLAVLLGAPEASVRDGAVLALPIGLDWLVLGALTTPPPSPSCASCGRSTPPTSSSTT